MCMEWLKLTFETLALLFQASISTISYVTLSHVLIALQFTPDESYPFLDPTTLGVL